MFASLKTKCSTQESQKNVVLLPHAFHIRDTIQPQSPMRRQILSYQGEFPRPDRPREVSYYAQCRFHDSSPQAGRGS